MEEEKQVFHIPIQQYERVLNMEFSRDKKEEIRELLTNHNQLQSQQEFDEVQNTLYEACKKGDIELIKICISETIENETKDLKFKINKTNKTASLFQPSKKIEHIFVPRIVTHESEEYLVTSICLTEEINFSRPLPSMKKNIKTIKFDENSSVNTIYPNSFSFTKIEEICFPKSLNELKEGWCSGANKLKKIIISESNDR